jgi:hypothetical protein
MMDELTRSEIDLLKRVVNEQRGQDGFVVAVSNDYWTNFCEKMVKENRLIKKRLRYNSEVIKKHDSVWPDKPARRVDYMGYFPTKQTKTLIQFYEL